MRASPGGAGRPGGAVRTRVITSMLVSSGSVMVVRAHRPGQPAQAAPGTDVSLCGTRIDAPARRVR
jgi:hypothetical protein